MNFKIFAASAALAVACVSTAAHASILSVIGGTSAALPANFALIGQPVYDSLQGGVGDIGDTITVFGADKSAANGLSLTEGARVSFTYLGAEAAFNNTSITFGSTLVTNADAPGVMSAPFIAGAGFVPFSFTSTTLFPVVTNTIANDGGRDANMRIGFSETFNGGRSILAFFDDTDLTDIDFDDLVVRIDVIPVSEIPLPAAAWMLLSALGGMGLLARKRANA